MESKVFFNLSVPSEGENLQFKFGFPQNDCLLVIQSSEQEPKRFLPPIRFRSVCWYIMASKAQGIVKGQIGMLEGGLGTVVD